MMSFRELVQAFVNDECGAILSAEAALLGTVGVLGAGVGVSAVAESVDEEMKEVAFAIRGLDQSYSIPEMGCKCGNAWTAGSCFTQAPVEESHAELQGLIDRIESRETAPAAESSRGDGSTPNEAEARPKRKRKKMQNRKQRTETGAVNEDSV